MNIERETAQGGRSMEARERQLREGAAVFVGRASFRMLPGAVANDSESNSSAGSTPTPLPAVPQERWFAPSEQVVLSPPESLIRRSLTNTQRVAHKVDGMGQGAAAMATNAPSLAGTRVLEHGFEGTLDVLRKSPLRRSTPLWAIAGAVILGATATLSAQAVMRRPPRLLSAIGHHTATATSNARPVVPARPTSTDVISPAAPASAAATPTVVPSTAPTAPAAAPAAPAAILKMVVTAERPRPPRAAGVGRPMSRPAAGPRATAEPRSATEATAPATAAWVDPFADEPANVKHDPAAKNARAARIAGVARSPNDQKAPAKNPGVRPVPRTNKGADWVDPFAN